MYIFDYNFPITTNPATSTFELLATKQNQSLSLGLYPNPVSEVLKLQTNEVLQAAEIYDLKGALLQREALDANQATLEVFWLRDFTYCACKRPAAWYRANSSKNKQVTNSRSKTLHAHLLVSNQGENVHLKQSKNYAELVAFFIVMVVLHAGTTRRGRQPQSGAVGFAQ